MKQTHLIKTKTIRKTIINSKTKHSNDKTQNFLFFMHTHKTSHSESLKHA